METKHTYEPGPWIVKGARVFPSGAGIDCIASMQVSNMSNWEETARLIAAAPDLLEALIELLKHGTAGDKERAVLAINKATRSKT